MSAQIDHNPTDLAAHGTLPYMAPGVASSLYRNGEVYINRAETGDSSARTGVVLAPEDRPVIDARALDASERRTLQANGFELLLRPLADETLDFFSHAEVVGHYYAECARLVQEATGAERVVAFDHNVRSAAGKAAGERITGGQKVQGPAQVVHGDYTLTGAPQRLRDLARPPSINDTYRSLVADGSALLTADEVNGALDGAGRFAIVNVWRNIAREPVRTHPLALCDAQTVEPRDLVVFEIRYPDRVGENYFAKGAARHRWYYYPAMTRDEALLIKQWDSAGPLARSGGAHGDASEPASPCTFSFHTAVDIAGTPADVPARWSIEVRCVALYG